MLFVTNLAAIVLSACAIYIVLGVRTTLFKKGRRRAQFTISFSITIAVLGLILIQLIGATYSRYQETRSEARIAQQINAWADDVSVEIVRIDVNSARKIADIWVIIDLPFSAQDQVASVHDLLPEELKEARLLADIRAIVGYDHAIAFRYQTRIAGRFDVMSPIVEEAPDIEETLQEE